MITRKKGQVWSLDFVTSVLIFLIVLIPLFFVWNHVNAENQQQRAFEDIEGMTLSLSDSIIRTKGYPEGWNNLSVTIIGLASEENVLNSTKVNYFLTMGNSNYNITRAILTGSYDFFFELRDINGTLIGTIGSKSGDRMVVPIERYCLLNERIVKMELALMA
ncbi:MAG: hypothetical protein KAS04_02170 [Candidatus Aenigmarchaeota archaeon]|nr:hypothetical protein [Candidatus Aenigmarchaeota archaeon]